MNDHEVYTFDADIRLLHYLVDTLVSDFTPRSTQRCCKKIKDILDRIEENRCDSYVPIEVKQYFRTKDED